MHAHEIIVKYQLKGMVLGSLLWDKVYKSDSFGLEQVIIDQFWVYLQVGVKTCEVFCFISIVRVGSIMLTSLFYVSAECQPKAIDLSTRLYGITMFVPRSTALN